MDYHIHGRDFLYNIAKSCLRYRAVFLDLCFACPTRSACFPDPGLCTENAIHPDTVSAGDDLGPAV